MENDEQFKQNIFETYGDPPKDINWDDPVIKENLEKYRIKWLLTSKEIEKITEELSEKMILKWKPLLEFKFPDGRTFPIENYKIIAATFDCAEQLTSKKYFKETAIPLITNLYMQ